MDFLATPARRRILFACLYLSEGAPIGFIWLTLPTRMAASEVPEQQITTLMSMLVLPWTFKFAWAPLVDGLRTDRWTLRHWIVSAQLAMGLTLAPLIWLDPRTSFSQIVVFLLLHALAAATQDVSIDALCISHTDVLERGRLNGWMQAGMLLGRALMGGGALILSPYVDDSVVVLLLIGLTTFSMILVLMSSEGNAKLPESSPPARRRWPAFTVSALALLGRNSWLGVFFALVGPAAFKSLEVLYGPFLVARGFSKADVGWLSLPMIVYMICGAILGGTLADRMPRKRLVAVALLMIAGSITLLAMTDWALGRYGSQWLVPQLILVAFGIGVFTAATYALLMDISSPRIAATQFSMFMGATNGCEAWSVLVIGWMIAWYGYPSGMLLMCLLSLMGLPILAAIRWDVDRECMQ